MSGNFLKQFIKFPTSKSPIIAQPVPQKVTIPRIGKFCEKIVKLRKQHQQIQCITDYDHTLTKFKYNGKKCDALFGMWVKQMSLPIKFREDLLNNYLHYGPYQTDGTITFPEKVQLINQLYYVQTKLFEQHRITAKQAVCTLDASHLVFRAFSRRLFEVLNDSQIPLYIISGGISDIIYTSIHDLFNHVYPNISIHSNELEIYKHQQIHEDLIRFKKPLIHSYNKYQIMMNHSRRKNCILMGDLESDIYMARGAKYQTILSIFYAKQGQTDQRAYAEDKFDLIVEDDGSHKIVVELIKIIKGKKNINWQYLSSIHKNLHEHLV